MARVITALLRIGTKVRTIDRGARIHGRSPDKPEAIGIIRDHFRPFGRQSKDRTPPYYVTFEDGEATWYDADEVEPLRGSRSSTRQPHAKKSAEQLNREITEALAGSESSTLFDEDEAEAERIAQAELAEQRLKRQQRDKQDDWRQHESATNYEDKLKFWSAYAKHWGTATAIKRASEVVASNFISRDFGETAASFYKRSPAARATRDWLKSHRE